MVTDRSRTPKQNPSDTPEQHLIFDLFITSLQSGDVRGANFFAHYLEREAPSAGAFPVSNDDNGRVG